MSMINVKTHLICTDVHDEYRVEWCGKIADTRPKFKDGKPIFVIVGSSAASSRMEVNTTDMNRLIKCCKLMTQPKGRAAVTSDKARIFIKEESGKETLIGVVFQSHIKQFAPMYDKFESL